MRRLQEELRQGKERLKAISNDVNRESHGEVSRPVSSGLQLLKGYYYYVYDYRSNQVSEMGGFEDVLGYSGEQLNTELLATLVHPKDAAAVVNIGMQCVELIHAADPPYAPYEALFTLDFRVRKANGKFIRILNQTTTYQVDESTGLVVSTISFCRDISSIKRSERVGWQWNGRGDEVFNPKLIHFEDLEYQPSDREMDVIRLLAEGLSSLQIGKELNISVHTVNNHRSNILSRCGLSTTVHLVRLAVDRRWV